MASSGDNPSDIADLPLGGDEAGESSTRNPNHFHLELSSNERLQNTNHLSRKLNRRFNAMDRQIREMETRILNAFSAAVNNIKNTVRNAEQTMTAPSRPAITQDARFRNTPSMTPQPSRKTASQASHASPPPPPAPRSNDQRHYREEYRGQYVADENQINYSLIPKASQNSKYRRTPDGRYDFTQRYSHLPLNQQAVKMHFPAMILPEQAPYEVEDCYNLKVIVPASLRLGEADHTVITKLGDIQDLFMIHLIPYSRWAWRLTSEMSDDFEQVKLWARSIGTMTMPWIMMVEAILQVLGNHHVIIPRYPQWPSS